MKIPSLINQNTKMIISLGFSLISISAFCQTMTNFDYLSTGLLNQAFKCPAQITVSLEDGKNEILSASGEISEDHLVSTTKVISGFYYPNGRQKNAYETTITSTVHPTHVTGRYPVTTTCSQVKL